MANKNKLRIILLFLTLYVALRYLSFSAGNSITVPAQFWNIRSIDVMKYSRDLAREKLNDEKFTQVIDQQIGAISSTGANYVAIGVPYDPEFLPIMHRWVYSARSYGLKVWFRGNLSGWEGWFEYPSITRAEHTQKIQEFIIKNADLFEDGDLFSSCPECENGGPGDPRHVGGVTEYRHFLISETDTVRQSFRKIGKDITQNLHSMNGDVAKLVMDKETTQRLGGIVVIDHYVETPEKLISDIQGYAKSSGGSIILGEFGAPIPDIHGNMTESQQSNWVQSAMQALSQEPSVIGLNYWTSFGGSTRLWNDDGTSRQVVKVISEFFSPVQLKSQVVTWFNLPLSGAQVYLGRFSGITAKNGQFSLPKDAGDTLEVSKEGFGTYNLPLPAPQKIYLQPLTTIAFFKYLILHQ